MVHEEQRREEDMLGERKRKGRDVVDQVAALGRMDGTEKDWTPACESSPIDARDAFDGDPPEPEAEALACADDDDEPARDADDHADDDAAADEAPLHWRRTKRLTAPDTWTYRLGGAGTSISYEFCAAARTRAFCATTGTDWTTGAVRLNAGAVSLLDDEADAEAGALALLDEGEGEGEADEARSIEAVAAAAYDEATLETTAVALAPMEPAGISPFAMSLMHQSAAESVEHTASRSGVRT